MNIKSVSLIIALVLTSAACVENYAAREVSQGAAPARLVVTNAPAEARIAVDGRDIGTVAQNAEGVVLPLGRHDIIVSIDGQKIHSQAVFLSASASVEIRIP